MLPRARCTPASLLRSPPPGAGQGAPDHVVQIPLSNAHIGGRSVLPGLHDVRPVYAAHSVRSLLHPGEYHPVVLPFLDAPLLLGPADILPWVRVSVRRLPVQEAQHGTRRWRKLLSYRFASRALTCTRWRLLVCDSSFSIGSRRLPSESHARPPHRSSPFAVVVFSLESPSSNNHDLCGVEHYARCRVPTEASRRRGSRALSYWQVYIQIQT